MPTADLSPIDYMWLSFTRIWGPYRALKHTRHSCGWAEGVAKRSSRFDGFRLDHHDRTAVGRMAGGIPVIYPNWLYRSRYASWSLFSTNFCLLTEFETMDINLLSPASSVGSYHRRVSDRATELRFIGFCNFNRQPNSAYYYKRLVGSRDHVPDKK